MRCALLPRFEPSILAALVTVVVMILLWAPLKLGMAAARLWVWAREEI